MPCVTHFIYFLISFLVCSKDELSNKVSSYLTNEEKKSVMLDFERVCGSFSHSWCRSCHAVMLNTDVNKNNSANREEQKHWTCPGCRNKPKDYYLNNDMLPIWRDDRNNVHYEVPVELDELTLAEKMLIQRAAPFVPLRHLKNGVCGMTGHSCCFEQSVEGLVNALPRKKEDAVLLKVIKTLRTEIGSGETVDKTFVVNRNRVFRALFWLKRHNKHYKDVVIKLDGLDWIKGEDGVLEERITVDEVNTREDEALDINADLGPCPDETRKQIRASGDIQTFGYLNESNRGELSDEDAHIQGEIQESIKRSPNKKMMSIPWPASSVNAISEFECKEVFALAFPWLFPGGVGDPSCYVGQSLKDWGKHILRYKDGRFLRDKFFSFYSCNYIVRHQNTSSGNWFIRDFNKGGPRDLEELKERVASGDSSFIDRVTYFNYHVKGSTPFWHRQRAELYTWINHHVQAGHGPPMFFITLSCAENYWPDIIRLVKERVELAGGPSDECYHGSPKLHQFLNDYALVVQEYFQERVKTWLDTVGRLIFGINHYWVRYEFAPGRGQIHAHLLATSADNAIYKLCHEDYRTENGKQKRADRLSVWAEKKFGLTAMAPKEYDSHVNETHPSTLLLSDVTDERTDFCSLAKSCAHHKCSGFCMRPAIDKSG